MQSVHMYNPVQRKHGDLHYRHVVVLW